MNAIRKKMAIMLFMIGILTASVTSAELVPIYTSADSGFQCLRSYRGKVFGGTYGGSRIYRITSYEFVEEAIIPSESVSVLATCPDEGCLIANLERNDKSPTVFRRDDSTGRWVDTGIGNGFPEDARAMGIGAGTAGGKVWASSLPYLPGEDARGYVWSSADGINWNPGPNFSRSMPMTFGEYNGKVWTATIYGSDANGIYLLDAGTWRKVYNLPTDTWADDMVIFQGNLYISTFSGIFRMDSSETINRVGDGGHWFAIARDSDETEWLYTCAPSEWRCSGRESVLLRSRDGVTWEVYQRFPECECQGVAVIHDTSGDELYVGTRQEGGNGRIYYEKFLRTVVVDDDSVSEIIEPVVEFNEIEMEYTSVDIVEKGNDASEVNVDVIKDSYFDSYGTDETYKGGCSCRISI